ncbi:hypothetical protein L596_007208 [Steinernema carpocapsae]|uniref:CAF1B/HIR1 beta-propeller domain-containing protein n=1 Tax=Steinernema carpocapsae TaxID=34508 RepID=A0A4U5P995_STECR|nr:hypothetical protein L596_007208 [Steinernema carpocapsae]
MSPAVGMFHYMPPIYWHDRQSLLSVDVNRVPMKESPVPVYKMVTSSVQKEVRVWTFSFEGDSEQFRNGKAPLVVQFLSNLMGHSASVNVVKFSPAGDLIASGDVDGVVNIWRLSQTETQSPSKLTVDPEMPPNKELWVRSRNSFRHDSDVTDIAWNATGSCLCIASNDDSLSMVNVSTGKRVWRVGNFRHFPNGIAWDPLGKYIVVMSTDRKMDIIDARNGFKLKSFSQFHLGQNLVSGKQLPMESYRMFHDDTLGSFTRRADFSPGGELLFVPCAHLEAGATGVYGLYVFKRDQLNSDKPYALVPTRKAPFIVRSCPIMFKLLDKADNFIGLPYRVVYAAITKDTLHIFDSQHAHPIAYVENLHYNNLTDLSWTHDGKMLVVSSLEGFNSFVQINLESIGGIDTAEHKRPISPQPALIQPRKSAKRKTQAAETTPVVLVPEKSTTPLKEGNATKTPTATPKSSKTKSTGALLKFLKKGEAAEENEQASGSSTEEAVKQEKKSTKEDEVTPKTVKKAKKRIQVVTLDA